MVGFLGTVKENINALVAGAGASLQASLQNVNNYYNDVVQFQQKVRNFRDLKNQGIKYRLILVLLFFQLRSDVSASFEALEDEWQRKVQNMYNSGLDKIVSAAEAAKMEVRQRDPQSAIMGNNTVSN